MKFFEKIFGSNERLVSKLKPIVAQVNGFEERMRRLSDEGLKEETQKLRGRIAGGESEDAILPEAFALVREAARRVLGQRHFDVQILGGIVLHRGMIAEMKTGEGKTLTSTLAVYLNALSGKGVHVVTVNDYLARRDANWMGSIYDALGLSVSCIVHDAAFRYSPVKTDRDEVSVEAENMVPITRREAYAADVTYGTNNEFGFDYLRDNMVLASEQKAQRPLHYAIVDEVDSILIDEARTPLIISAPDTESTKLYEQFAHLVPRLVKDTDFTVDEKSRAVSLTEVGIEKVEKLLGVGNIYDPDKVQYVHHLEQSLKAHIIFHRDKDYVVKNGQVVIVDDFTGRLMEGRRYSEGLHQAIEAKEGVQVQKESRTLATVTFQNYFRMYSKLAGMTGTALTSAEEFAKVYHIDVVEIPTHRPMVRRDLSDIVYKTEDGKFAAISEHIARLHSAGQPVLVGTIAIEKSEALSERLKSINVPHEVLNAKQHEREATIISRAGQKGAVTIATNMAGRGTDIKLGEGVRELGGLVIIGSERHEARRIDNQLRGRAGRQGDPGLTQFYVSLEDELMRRFGGDKLKNLMNTLGLPDDQPIQNRLIAKTIENAQTKIEGFNFDIRKHVLDYDDVMNKQREVIYQRRNEILEKEDSSRMVLAYASGCAEDLVSQNAPEMGEDRDTDRLYEEASRLLNVDEALRKKLLSIADDKALSPPECATALVGAIEQEAKEAYRRKETEIGEDVFRAAVRTILLRTIDTLWINHLDEIEYVRQGIGLRGYGQRDPLIEYKKEAFGIFARLVESIEETTVRTVFHLTLTGASAAPMRSAPERVVLSGPSDNQSQFGATKSSGGSGETQKREPVRVAASAGRNDPCPCGSGKKYKKCHGK